MNIKENKISAHKVNKLRRHLVLVFRDMGLTLEEANEKANYLFHKNFINDKPFTYTKGMYNNK